MNRHRRKDRIAEPWRTEPPHDRGMHRGRTVLHFFFVGVLMLSGSAEWSVAQRSTVSARLDGRGSVELRTQVMSLVDSVVAIGLPSAPLIDKALEGVSKGADDRRIIAAVRAVAVALGTAGRALGKASSDELAVGASVLRAGVSPAALANVRRALTGRSLVVPLSVLETLVVQGTPPATATAAVVAYAKSNDDSHVLDFGRTVAQAIADGIAPAVAVSSGGGVQPVNPNPPALTIPQPAPRVPTVPKP